jgi:hypothetical protein
MHVVRHVDRVQLSRHIVFALSQSAVHVFNAAVQPAQPASIPGGPPESGGPSGLDPSEASTTAAPPPEPPLALASGSTVARSPDAPELDASSSADTPAPPPCPPCPLPPLCPSDAEVGVK